MKPFKFRVWDNKGKIWMPLINFYLGAFGDLYIQRSVVYPITTLCEYEEEMYEISYSTELFDKKGNEIFEGDILIDGEDFIGEVYFYSEHCRYLLKSESSYDDFWGVNELTIIGNKYENPDLIKQTNLLSAS